MLFGIYLKKKTMYFYNLFDEMEISSTVNVYMYLDVSA